MSGQLHAERATHNSSDYDVEHVDATPQPQAEELSAETDDLLDEIDGVLEENAQEFVDQYIQRGGQ